MMDPTDRPYDCNKAFWDNYLKGRPQAPEQLFHRIYKYHEEHGGQFGTVHDAGAGVGPYSAKLRERFNHVIVSDIAEGNVKQAEQRLGHDGYSYRTAKIEDASDIEPGSVDMVFASQVLHFADLDLAQEAFAHQLKSGGTVVITGFGIAHYADHDVQEIWSRMRQEGARVLVRHAPSPEAATRRLRTLARVAAGYKMAAFDEKFWEPGVQRISLNIKHRNLGFVGVLDEDLQRHVTQEASRVGAHDVSLSVEEEGWELEHDLQGIKDHFATFAFASIEPAAYEGLWREMEVVMKDGRKAKGVWPAKVILGTRR